MKTKTDLYFEQATTTYDTFNDVQEELFLLLLSLIEQKQFMHILDLGCASGRLSNKLFNIFNAKSLIGIDESKGMIKKAQEFYQDKHMFEFYPQHKNKRNYCL